MPVTINILGICVSRDAFGLFDNDGGFEIKKCVTNTSFLSLCSPKIADEDIAIEEDFSKIRHYFQRCACLDINKKVFDYIAEYDADYLLVDLGTVHRPVYKVKRKNADNGKEYTFITHTHALRQYSSYLNDKNIEVAKIVQFQSQYKKVYLNYAAKFAETLKKKYPQKKIIINELKYGERYIDSEGNIRSFIDTMLAKKNEMLSEVYAEFRKHLPDAHYIRFPGAEVLGNGMHKWGKNYFHFVMDYYEYLLEAIRITTANLKNEEKLLDVLYKQYTELIYKKYTLNSTVWENVSELSASEISLGETVQIMPLSTDESDLYKYTKMVFCKKADSSKWKKIASYTEKNKKVAFTPETTGEYDICIRIKDENNILKKKYLKLLVK